MRLGELAVAAVLCCLLVNVNAQTDCPGQLLTNGNFEEPNTELVPTEMRDQWANSKWGWYTKIPGWYTTRPDGSPCARVDWQNKYIEIARGALATPIEGRQYAELLPNGTGNYCQDVQLTKGATYRLSYHYGRLMTYTEGDGRGTHGRGQLTAFDTAVDAVVRPADYSAPASAPYPKDSQGFTVVSSADTAQNWQQQQRQWARHEATFTAPADKVTLAFINTKRSKTCGSCGSLLDAVCLQKA